VTSSRLAVRSRPRAQVPLLRIGLLAVAAVIAGALIGTVFHSEPPQRVEKSVPVSGAGVGLLPPAGWAQGGAVALPGFKRALWLRNAGEGLRAGVALLPADSPTLLPKALSANAWQPETLRPRSGYEVWRYRVETLAGSAGYVYTAPTTGGVATLACLGASVPKRCDALVSSMVVPGTRRLELSDRAALPVRGSARVGGGPPRPHPSWHRGG